MGPVNATLVGEVSMDQVNKQNEPAPNGLRRKLFRGVPAGFGVLLAVQAKTALGATVTCQSPSAMMSGNTSPRPGGGTTCSGGLSPGYWKVPQHFGSWAPAGATYPTFKNIVVECSTGMSGLTLSSIKTAGTLVTTVLPGASVPVGTGIWAVLAFPGSFTGGQLMRHLSAAWLNAGYFGSQYPLTRSQIQDMWAATMAGGTYCPVGVTCTPPWTGTDVINYISGMYDINASGGDPSLCVK